MDFNEARQEYFRLRRSYQEGLIGPELFQKAVRNLSVVDEHGHGWQIGVNSGQWYRRDDARGWVADEPPLPQDAAAEPPEKLEVLALPTAPPERLADARPRQAAAPGQQTDSPQKIQLPQKAWLAIAGAMALLLVSCLALFGSSAALGGLLAFNLFAASPREASAALLPTRTATITLTARPTRTPTGSPAPTKTPRPSPTPGSALTTAPPFSDLPGQQWLLVRSADELWFSAPDGSALTLLEPAAIVSPQDLARAVSPQGGHIAYVIVDKAAATYSLQLKILQLPEGRLVKEIALLSPNFTEGEGAGRRSPEAARAITEQESLAWSPDGQQLAFVGVMEGSSADLYLYDLRFDTLTRLSSAASQAFAPNWSPDNRYIVFFGAESFGPPGTFKMTGAWAARPSESGGVIDLYPSESGGEVLLGWSGLREFVAASYDAGCEYYNLRLVNIESQKVTAYYPGCFSAAALDPETNGVIFTIPQDLAVDCACQQKAGESGLYLVPNGKGLPRKISAENGRAVRWQPDARLFYATTVEGETLAFNIAEEQIELPEPVGGVYPRIAPVSGWWAWAMPPDSEESGLWLGDLLQRTPRQVFAETVESPLWDDDGQTLLFFSGKRLYTAPSPGFAPLPAAEFAAPVDQAVWVRP